jgi:DNA-binding protein H-NS
MAQTYQQIQRQIEQLQRQAEALRNTEVKGVIDRIKVAIAHYGLTAAHLGLDSASRKAVGKKSARSFAHFSDGAGNAWSGRGPRPRWLREALAAGRSIEEFKSGSTAKSKPAPAIATVEAAAPAAKAPAKKAKRAASKVHYSDGAGNAWSGRGPRPRWLREALAAGRSIEEFKSGSTANSKPASAIDKVQAATPAAKVPAKKAKRAPSKVHYSDGAGNSWTGRGPKPRWLKAAIDSGKTLQDFLS